VEVGEAFTLAYETGPIGNKTLNPLHGVGLAFYQRAALHPFYDRPVFEHYRRACLLGRAFVDVADDSRSGYTILSRKRVKTHLETVKFSSNGLWPVGPIRAKLLLTRTRPPI
jgi:hypothetical protein